MVDMTFFNKVKRNAKWITVGSYLGILFSGFVGYQVGYISLLNLILYAVLAPATTYIVYWVRGKKYEKIFMRLTLVVGGCLALGFPIWLLIDYLLYVPEWAPFHGNKDILAGIAFILSTVFSYGLAGYILDKLGKKRDYKPFL